MFYTPYMRFFMRRGEGTHAIYSRDCTKGYSEIGYQTVDIRCESPWFPCAKGDPYSVRGSEGYKAVPARFLQGRGLAKNPKLFVKFGAIRQTLISAC